ncbi:MAG: ABC transporter substrate binding protein [Sulfurimonas sp.]|uniref:ABC transporter substrate-binding protein n=1 Tax=Sulfurimonas sp. TaxID=2022749 RepID=UPI0026368C06|nr:ABC transporter substrate binding protein [Sulfurimonas sp.]MDD2653363.1 ABC transporter substrate binding protein [Sulfurimonas sp.]MDD3450669.1 ABC transporter substrate binding protein [Sulfurimonas sp.]
MLKIFFLLFCLAYALYGSQKIRIFALHSYSQEYEWTKNQHSSFVSTLEQNTQEFEIYSEYLDTKRVDFTPEYQNKFIEYLQTKYADATPSLIYVSDDNALRFVHEHYEKLFQNSTNKIPVFFSGINDLGMHEKLPNDIYAGVYELKEIKPNIELIKQFSPQTRDIYIVGDNSNTYEFIKKEIQTQEAVFANLKFHYIGEDEISKIESQLPNKSKTFVILTTIGNIKDEKKSLLLPQESIRRMKQNKELVIMSMEDAYMHKGVVGGYVTSGLRQGEEAAKLVLRYLDEKTLKNVASLLKSPNLYIFNSKELVEARVILSEYIARNSTILGKDKDFIEKNRTVLLNIFAVMTAIFFFTTVTLYVMLQKKDFSSQE